MEEIKKFFKELKRTRWASGEVTKKTFWNVIIFVSIFALVAFGLAIGFSTMWDSLGVGL